MLVENLNFHCHYIYWKVDTRKHPARETLISATARTSEKQQHTPFCAMANDQLRPQGQGHLRFQAVLRSTDINYIEA